MKVSREMLILVLCSILLLLSIVSLAVAQQESPSPKTIQLFAEEDDPSGRIPVSNESIFRKREALINPVLLSGDIENIRRGDKLVGYLFDDKYVEATVNNLDYDRGEIRIYAELPENQGSVEIRSRGKFFSLDTFHESSQKRYRCQYVPAEDRIVVIEVESMQARAARKARAVAAARAAGPKTIQLFAEDDDPASRITWDKTAPATRSYIRMRKASANPLLADKFDEIFIGDTIAGYLFEDEYFEAVVTKREKGGLLPSLTLKATDDKTNVNWISISLQEKKYYLDFVDQSRNREFWITYSEKSKSYIVVERDLSKVRVR